MWFYVVCSYKLFFKGASQSKNGFGSDFSKQAQGTYSAESESCNKPQGHSRLPLSPSPPTLQRLFLTPPLTALLSRFSLISKSSFKESHRSLDDEKGETGFTDTLGKLHYLDFSLLIAIHFVFLLKNTDPLIHANLTSIIQVFSFFQIYMTKVGLCWYTLNSCVSTKILYLRPHSWGK